MSECFICFEEQLIFNKPCPTCKHSCCIQCYDRIVADNPDAKCSMCRTSYYDPVLNQCSDIPFENLVLMDLDDAVLRRAYSAQKPQMTEMAERGAVAALEWIHRVIDRKKKYTITRGAYSIFEIAIMSGQVESMEWLYRNHLWKSKHKRAAALAIQHNQFESLKWLHAHDFFRQDK
jgi:hypothetical protein